MQDMTTRQWSKRGTVISVRTAQDDTVANYLLTLPDDDEAQRAAPGETGLEREGREQPAHYVKPQLRRSERLQAAAQDGF